ncbi:MAG: hypothetical protein AAF403_00945, partial [Pseudomonadota bacterium]
NKLTSIFLDGSAGLLQDEALRKEIKYMLYDTMMTILRMIKAIMMMMNHLRMIKAIMMMMTTRTKKSNF